MKPFYLVKFMCNYKDEETNKFIEYASTSQTDLCINWPFTLSPQGYGRIPKRINKSILAHRYILEIVTGEIGEIAMHACDNRSFVNPRHLKWGSQKDNMQDMINKKRDVRGEGRWNAVLNDELVLKIKKEYIPRSKTCGTRALSRKYGIKQTTISAAVRGVTWNHVKIIEDSDNV